MKKFWAWVWNKRNNDWGCIGCEVFIEGLILGTVLILLIIKFTMWLENYL